jgi:hypothetical protein
VSQKSIPAKPNFHLRTKSEGSGKLVIIWSDSVSHLHDFTPWFKSKSVYGFVSDPNRRIQFKSEITASHGGGL